MCRSLIYKKEIRLSLHTNIMTSINGQAREKSVKSEFELMTSSNLALKTSTNFYDNFLLLVIALKSNLYFIFFTLSKILWNLSSLSRNFYFF